MADIGGGKGLLAYLLYLDGWDVTVIDPERTLPMKKFKDFQLDKRIRLTEEDWQKIKWVEKEFVIEMARDYDLLISLHGHGVNMKIIEAAAKYDKKFVLLPCCVIDEPIVKQPGINWYQSLIKFAVDSGLEVNVDQLDFKGKNKVIYND